MEEAKHKGTENLVTTRQRSKEEVKAMQRKGGINSGIARRAKKSKRERFGLLLSGKVPLADKDAKQAAQELGRDVGALTQEDLIDARALIDAKKGDRYAREHIAKVMGWYGEPSNNVNVNVTGVQAPSLLIVDAKDPEE